MSNKSASQALREGLYVDMPGDEGSVVLAFVADKTRGINPTKHEHTRAGLRRAQGAIQCGGTVAG